MAKKLLLIAKVYFSLLTGFFPVFGQTRPDSLFSSNVPLEIGMNISIERLKNSNGDSAWVSDMLYYRNNAGLSDSIKVKLKTRGFYRLNQCYFPPLSIKIAKKEAKGTGFEGNRKMKLVVPCDNQKRSNALIVREYLCYKLCEVITPYAFRTRLVNLDLTEQRGRKTRNFKLKGILVEDLEKLAKRCDAKAEEKTSIPPDGLQDTSALRFYMFQLLIANTDWSTTAQHNVKLIHQRSGNYISLPYDFDLSGVVNAPYSFVSLDAGTQLPIDNVTQRLYRGYCRAPGVTEFVRREMLAKEKELIAVPEILKGELDDKEIRGLKKYLDEFFDILRNDFLFRTKVLENCRAL